MAEKVGRDAYEASCNLIVEMTLAGSSCQEVLARLDADGRVSMRGRPFQSFNVMRIIRDRVAEADRERLMHDAKRRGASIVRENRERHNKAVLPRVLELYRSLGDSAAVADALNLDKVRTSIGGSWTGPTVSRLMRVHANPSELSEAATAKRLDVVLLEFSAGVAGRSWRTPSRRPPATPNGS